MRKRGGTSLGGFGLQSREGEGAIRSETTLNALFVAFLSMKMEENVSYWPSVSDLFMTLFIISMVMLAAVYYVLMPKQAPADQRAILEAVGVEMEHIRAPVNQMRGVLRTQPEIRP